MKKKGILFFTLILAALILSGCPGIGTDPEETPTAPAAPQGITITPDDGQLVVIWLPVDGADKYDVKWGEEPSEIQEDISGTSCSISSGLTNDIKYLIQVRAKNKGGASEWSEAEEGTPKKQNSVPAKPSQPIVTSNGATLIVKWTAVEGATKYQVYYGLSANPTKKHEENIPGTSVEITVSESGIYYVRIKAGNSKGESDDYSPDGSALVTVSGTPSVLGSWESVYYIYTFTKDEKLTRTSKNDKRTVYYSYNSTTREFYQETAAEPDGCYVFSGGKLQLTTFLPSTYQREGTGSGIVGTWENNGETWTFADNTAKRIYSNGSETNYMYKILSDSKISVEIERGILVEDTLTLSGYNLSRIGSGSGIIGFWSSSQPGLTLTVTITQDKMEYTQIDHNGKSQSNSSPIRIDSNKIYIPDEYGYKLDDDTLTIITDRTEECSPVPANND
jgi:hypothetical protein